MTTYDLSIVIPVLNEQANIPKLIEKLQILDAGFKRVGISIEFVVNNNNSTDNSGQLLMSWAEICNSVNLETFHTTVSFQTSIIRGMKRSSGLCVIVLQSDLQDPPELIPELFRSWQSGNLVTVALPLNRHSNLFQDMMRKSFYRLMSAGNTEKLVVGFQDFYAIDQSVAKSLSSRNEKFQFIRGSLASEFGIDNVISYDREKRKAGKSKFSFFDKYDLAMDALLVYSSKFIRILAICGFVLAGISFMAMIVVGVSYFAGIQFGIPGWASTFSLILLALGINLLFFSLLFEFLSRILVLLMSKKS